MTSTGYCATTLVSSHITGASYYGTELEWTLCFFCLFRARVHYSVRNYILIVVEITRRRQSPWDRRTKMSRSHIKTIKGRESVRCDGSQTARTMRSNQPFSHFPHRKFRFLLSHGERSVMRSSLPFHFFFAFFFQLGENIFPFVQFQRICMYTDKLKKKKKSSNGIRFIRTCLISLYFHSVFESFSFCISPFSDSICLCLSICQFLCLCPRLSVCRFHAESVLWREK